MYRHTLFWIRVSEHVDKQQIRSSRHYLLYRLYRSWPGINNILNVFQRLTGNLFPQYNIHYPRRGTFFECNALFQGAALNALKHSFLIGLNFP